MRIGRLKSFVLSGGVGVLALAAVGVRAATTIETIQVTNDPLLQRDPAVKGGQVAYTEFDAAFSGDIWVYTIDDGSRVRAVDPAFASFSQSVEDIDGGVVVYGDDRNAPGLDIFAITVPGLVPSNVVVATGNQTEPAISGNRVVWEHSVPPSGNVDIYVGCVLGCSNTQLTSDPSVQFRPAISGELVVWEDARSVSGSEGPHIFASWLSLAPTGHAAGEYGIATSGVKARNPDVNGTRIVWEQQATGLDQKDIYLYDFAVGGSPIQITTNLSNQTRPRISGNLIVWEDQRNAANESASAGAGDAIGNGTDLYGYDLNTNTEIAFVTGPRVEHIQDIDVRADGSWDIAYTIDQGGGDSDIYVLRAKITADPTPEPTATATEAPTATPTPEPEPAPSGDPCDPASGAPQYFSETFERDHAAPTREERHFDAVAGPGTLCLTLEHVSSAWVDFNGDDIFGPNAFNPNTTSARADITLLDGNELGVKLAGAPGGRMTVRVVGAIPAPTSGLALSSASENGPTSADALAGNDSGANGASCSVSPVSGSPLAGLVLLGGLVFATRRRRSL